MREERRSGQSTPAVAAPVLAANVQRRLVDFLMDDAEIGNEMFAATSSRKIDVHAHILPHDIPDFEKVSGEDNKLSVLPSRRSELIRPAQPLQFV